ncbi:aminopeptidase [Natronogracilivirga saccharolytica]|uniref:Aminopeptidase n=1 Tax=Natronogracilivirga saccharolytica TaxID=2812953 RepID=A0A8J7USE2_9BACT|nr:aminopeptidase [Natronogracilivirga saccharolytica]MBP3191451.1 aminopeptidase [Natronogracilivirga saccharolytica]
MTDPRDYKLAETIITHSTRLEKGERILINLIGFNGIGLVRALVTLAREIGAHPYLDIVDPETQRILLETGDAGFWKDQAESDGVPLMKQMDAFVGIRASENIYESSKVPEKANRAFQQHYLQPVHFDERVKNTKWCVLRYPSPAFAMNARMPTSAFTDFYYNACLLDYARLRDAMLPLEERLRKASEVRLKGEGTDIRLHVDGQDWVNCHGTRNIPDGELFSSPLRDSVNGRIRYAPSVYLGKPFDFVELTVKDGVVTDFDASDREALQSILDTDEGSRRFGEFSFGTNPVIGQPMYDILFDEKIYGSNHLTLGQDYDEAPNGNKSQVHWDLVCIGADVYLDGELIRKGRHFVPDDLQILNPDNFFKGR